MEVKQYKPVVSSIFKRMILRMRKNDFKDLEETIGFLEQHLQLIRLLLSNQSKKKKPKRNRKKKDTESQGNGETKETTEESTAESS